MENDRIAPWMKEAAKAILHAGSWPDEWEPKDVTEIAQIIAAHVPQPTEQEFDVWWEKDGKFFDPDTADVPWYDKRKFLAEYAWHRARQEKL